MRRGSENRQASIERAFAADMPRTFVELIGISSRILIERQTFVDALRVRQVDFWFRPSGNLHSGRVEHHIRRITAALFAQFAVKNVVETTGPLWTPAPVRKSALCR